MSDSVRSTNGPTVFFVGKVTIPPSWGSGGSAVGEIPVIEADPSTNTGPEIITPLTSQAGYARNGFTTQTLSPRLDAASQNVRPGRSLAASVAARSGLESR